MSRVEVNAPRFDLPDEHVYEGWQEIADELEVSVRTAQRYVHTHGLKVAKGPGFKVWAERGWLVAWKAANVTLLGKGNAA